MRPPIGPHRGLARLSAAKSLNVSGRSAIVATYLALVLAVEANAQGEAASRATVIVSVADQQGRPVENAELRIPDLHLLVRTNWMGQGLFRALPGVSYRLEVRKIGYMPVFATVVAETDTVGVFIALEPMIASLDTQRVVGLQVPNNLQSYARRRALGIGRFLDDTVMEKEQTRSLPIVLAERFPGVRAAPNGGGRYVLLSTRSSGRMRAGDCTVDVYVDGARYYEDLDGIRPIDLAGVELYSMGAAPVEYRRASASCNVLLLWLRH
ncbi:MAG: hypothetical protein JWL61_1348 [Gemmatimonadetes bacterium]|jgi:hypothetical protein|nr:hypothetical protein [Gemmatimonadota bacterium]